MSNVARAVKIAAWLVAVTSIAAAPQQQPVFRGGVDLVQLDVSVLDKHRQPVHGLTTKDFTVIEDGHAQKIVALSEITAPEGYLTPPVWTHAARPDIASNEVGDKRLFAIYVGTTLPSPTRPLPNPYALALRPDPAMIESRIRIVNGVIDRLGPGDMAAIVPGRGGCYVPFTDNLEILRACADSIGGPLGSAVTGPNIPSIPIATSAIALPEFVQLLAAVPQKRKAIIYVGPAVPDTGYYELVAMAQRANVNIYPINPKWLTPLFTSASMVQRFKDLGSLLNLAADTGGVAITDLEKLDAGLDQMFVENASYYLIGYHTSHPELDGKKRTLSVKVAGKDVLVRTRTATFRPKVNETVAVPAAAKPSAGLERGVKDLLPDLDVTFDVAVMPFAQQHDSNATLAIVTGLTEPVAPGVTRVVQHMDVRVIVYAEGGAVIVDNTRRAPLDAVPSAENRVRYDVLSDVALPPGHYDFRLTAHNVDTDKIGAIEFPITVPDFAHEPVSMSGVVISATSAEPMATIGKLGPIVPVVPTATRRFLRDDHVSVFARVYEGGTDAIAPATLAVQILDAKGATKYSVTEALTSDQFVASRAADYRLDLPLLTLAPGQYLLTMQASVGTRRAPQRDVRFVVR